MFCGNIRSSVEKNRCWFQVSPLMFYELNLISLKPFSKFLPKTEKEEIFTTDLHG
jgi:hypothetical protein